MNKDHQLNMRKYFLKFKNIDISENEELEFAGIKPYGFDILYNREKYHFSFNEPLESYEDVRFVFKELSK